MNPRRRIGSWYEDLEEGEDGVEHMLGGIAINLKGTVQVCS